MEKILACSGLRLIKKYGQYYIAFMIGELIEYPAHLHITEKEALTIMSNNEEIENVFDDYSNRLNWDLDYFIDSGIKDYLFYECRYDEAAIENAIKKLETQRDIKKECYETLAYEEFPVDDAITECGFTAEKLYRTFGMNIAEAYLFLAEARENPEGAMEELNKWKG